MRVKNKLWFEYTIRMGLFFLFLALVLPGHYLPFVSFHQEYLSFVGLLVLVFYLVISGHPEIKVGMAAMAVLIVSIIPLIQYSTGVIFYFGDAFLSSIYLGALFLAIVVGQNIPQGLYKNFTEKLFLGFLLTSVLSSFIVMYQWLELDGLGMWIVDVSPDTTPGANLAQRNLFATLACMGLVALFYYKHKLELGALPTFLVVFVLVFGLAICQSRTPWVIGAVSIVWVFFKTKVIAQRASALCWLLFSVLLYLFFSLWFLEELSNHLLMTKDSYIRPGELGVRSVLWAQFFKAIMDGQWFGYGWQQASIAQFSVAPFFPKAIYVDRSHNLFLDLMVWNGLVPGLLIIGAILYWAWQQVLKCNSNLHQYILWSIGCIAVHSMFEFPYEYAFFLIPLGFFIGISERLNNGRILILKFGRFALSLLLLVAIVLMGVVFNDYKVAKAQLVSIRYESAGIMGAEKMLVPGGTVLTLTQITALLNFAGIEAHENMTEVELEFMRKISNRFSFPPSLFRYALALGLNHHYKEAERVLLVLQKLHAEDIYAEAVENWKVMSEKYPQLVQVKPPKVDYVLIKDTH